MGNNRSTEKLLNDDVSDPDGTRRNLRVYHPKDSLEGYQISDQEVGATSYYGYLNADGAWYIQRGIQAGAEINYTYKKGSSGYSWAGRGAAGYASFSDTF